MSSFACRIKHINSDKMAGQEAQPCAAWGLENLESVRPSSQGKLDPWLGHREELQGEPVLGVLGFSKLFSGIYFHFTCVHILPDMSVHHVCAGSQRSQKKASDSLGLE